MELIPDNVPEPTEDQALGATPGRLWNLVLVSDLQHLNGPFHTILDNEDWDNEHILDIL